MWNRNGRASSTVYPCDMRAILAIDTSSPTVSVAVARSDGRLARRATPQRDSSPVLLRMIDECLGEAEVTGQELDGILALRGPGSFTGLRVGLATALGLHQATRVPATGAPTLACLAAAAPVTGRPVLAAVEALRGEWFVQRFLTSNGNWPQALDEPRKIHPSALDPTDIGVVSAHDVDRLASLLDPKIERAIDPGALAPVAARLALRRPPSWEPGLLTKPLYLSGPAVQRPGPPKSVLDDGARA